MNTCMDTFMSQHEAAHPRLGRRMAHFNRMVTNRVTLPLAPWLPGFGVVEHTGRTSARRYRTPVNVFRVPDGYVIALTYGKDSDWVKNVTAANGCDLITRGHRCRLTSPEIIHDEKQQMVPAVIRPILRLMRVADFLHLKTAQE